MIHHHISVGKFRNYLICKFIEIYLEIRSKCIIELAKFKENATTKHVALGSYLKYKGKVGHQNFWCYMLHVGLAYQNADQTTFF